MSESAKMSHLDILLILLDAAEKIGCGVKLRKSGVIALVDGINALNSRIAELETFSDKLIEAGNALESEAYDAWRKDGMLDFPAAETWLKLVQHQKEREK